MDNREELISAYLDGELSDEEQQQVMQLLSEDEAARQLFADFQSLRSSLRSSFRALPADPVDHAFSKEVLERVEQVSPEQPKATPSPAPREPTFRPRTLLWPAMAIAAAIMLMVFYDEPNFNERSSHDATSQNGLLARLDDAPKGPAMMAKPQQPPSSIPEPLTLNAPDVTRAVEVLERERAEVVENPDTLVDTEVKSQITNAPALTQADARLLETTGKAIAQLKIKQPAGSGGSSDGFKRRFSNGFGQKREAKTKRNGRHRMGTTEKFVPEPDRDCPEAKRDFPEAKRYQRPEASKVRPPRVWPLYRLPGRFSGGRIGRGAGGPYFEVRLFGPTGD